MSEDAISAAAAVLASVALFVSLAVHAARRRRRRRDEWRARRGCTSSPTQAMIRGLVEESKRSRDQLLRLSDGYYDLYASGSTPPEEPAINMAAWTQGGNTYHGVPRYCRRCGRARGAGYPYSSVCPGCGCNGAYG